jgi:hypothetical protein
VKKGRVGIRGPRVPDLPDLDDDDLVRAIREYEPKLATRAIAGHTIKLTPWRHPSSGVRLRKGGGIEILPARHRSGAPSIPLYWLDDEFIPVLDYAAHLLARRVWAAVRRDERKVAIAIRIGISVQAVELAEAEPRVAIPTIILELRGITAEERSLAKRRAAWKGALEPAASRRRQLYALETHLRSFLGKPRLRLARGGHA